ncbi:hypothetical protein QOZ98_003085 [Planomicrobium stackebrandtii]|uniref:Uncharacterized protein n=1 Tax=Planomicrobium stackebrandtii TaxID=253160 RepID=A0ABU0GY06_9BACL|nr:hypothetical protein [Planomicrobium stackebrandtii]
MSCTYAFRLRKAGMSEKRSGSLSAFGLLTVHE